jgi:histone H3/H4
MPRISMDAIEAGSEELQKAWKKARSDDRKTIRAEDFT